MTREERIAEMQRAGAVNKYHKTTVDRLITQYKSAPRSRKNAISAQCAECFGWDAPLQENIRGCTDTGCPLFNWRPYK